LKAEDITQEAFLSLWRSKARYDRVRGSVRTWLLGIVRNRAIDLLRHDVAGAPQVNLEADLPERPAATEETDAEALRREAARQVRGALEVLPRDQMRVIELAYFGGLTHAQIADMLGMPLGTVKGRMRLGMEKIRAYLAEELG
jgi:RNA polymerase sigma-70 factor (ECF subfamily)